jgi:hypothetical protein
MRREKMLEVSKNSPIGSKVSDLMIYIRFLELTWYGFRNTSCAPKILKRLVSSFESFSISNIV